MNSNDSCSAELPTISVGTWYSILRVKARRIEPSATGIFERAAGAGEDWWSKISFSGTLAGK